MTNESKTMILDMGRRESRMRIMERQVRFLAGVSIVVLSLLTGCKSTTPVEKPSAARPNIIIVMADDMGYSDAHCMGSEIDTPNLDRLAREGVTFTQFYNTARCCPTRASLLTGSYPHQADVGHMTGSGVDIEGYRNELSHHAVTIAEVLKTAGYSTYM